MKKLKKTLAWVLSLAMVMTMIPMFTVMSSADGEEDVCIVLDSSDNPVGNPYTTIQAAIDKIADETAGGSTIQMIKDQVETIDVYVECTLDLNGHVLDGNKQGSVITVEEVAFTLKDGDSDQTHADGYAALPAGGVVTGGTGTVDAYGETFGGGVYNNQGSFEICGGTIYGNNARYGGGVYNHYSWTGLYENGSISFNTAYEGGGVYIEEGSGEDETGTFVMYGGTINYNNYRDDGVYTDDQGDPFSFGGGIYNEVGTILLIGGTIENNGGYEGGGVYNCSEFKMTEKEAVICNNTAYYGAGVYNDSGSGFGCYFEFTAGSISNNVATGGTIRSSIGGGVENEGEFTMSGEAIISENKADEKGGGVFNGGEFTMEGEAVISGNQAGEKVEGYITAKYSN